MSTVAFSSLSLLQKLTFLLRSYYKKNNLSSNDFYWVETEVAKIGLMKLISANSENIEVIPNTYSSNFIKKITKDENLEMDEYIKVLTIASPYPHKNLKIIPKVANILSEKDKVNKYKFFVTLPEESNNKIVNNFWSIVKKESVKEMIHNLGVLKNHECPYWYLNSDIVFMPTLLETSSAVYPESMLMNKPIITTDLDFAHASCGDAALYYEPLSAESASDLIMKLSVNKKLRAELISNGKKRLELSPKPNEKYKIIIKCIEGIVSK
jgi:glycosyltransferase involved in cell wall biosynthesis